jgi:ATP-dependent Clp protease, protease subunit
MKPATDLHDAVEASLFARRIIMVGGTVDDARAGEIATALMALDALGDEHVELRLSSSEATVGAASTLTDVIDVLGVPVHVSASGIVAAGAVGVLAAGAHRRISAHGIVRLSRPDEPVPQVGYDLAEWAGGHDARQRAFGERLARDTGRAIDLLTDALRHGRILSAAEAVEWNVVDGVEEPATAVTPRSIRPVP